MDRVGKSSVVLAEHANDIGECWYGMGTLVAETGVTERTVQKAMGLLTIDGAGGGDDAFYDSGHNGRLTFKKGYAFVTMEVLGTKVDTSTPTGRNEQLEMEKNMELVALTHFK